MGAVAHYSEASVEPGRCFRFVHDAAKATPSVGRSLSSTRGLMAMTFSVGFAAIAAVASLAAAYMARRTLLGVPVA